MIQRPRLPFLVLLLPLLLVPAAAPLRGQDHPNVEKGFNPERTFQAGDVDHVNLFNGNLLLTIPLGQSYPVGGGLSYRLSLVYNSQLWEFQTRADQLLMTEFTQGRPSRRANAGLGWTVSLGRLFAPESEGNDTLVWVYVSPDGAAHNFYARLHHGDPEDAGDSGEVWDAAQRVQYTRD
ncbi:MAG TPA: hypothetical protein VL025_02795, partial [Thermoanaerobaculia bacterium]|nr:hypothetical protein [Thermoanaerobaculia bacterium]